MSDAAETRTYRAYTTYEGEAATASAAGERRPVLSGSRGLRHNDIVALAVARRVLGAVGEWLMPGPEGCVEALWNLVVKLRADVRDLERLAAERELIIAAPLRNVGGDGI